MKNLKQYYRELGRIVYAVAIADGTVQNEEIEKLHEMVLKEMAGSEKHSDSSGMNEAFYVDFEFENSQLNKQTMEEAMMSFNKFLAANFESGDEPLLNRSVALLEEVAKAYDKKKEHNIIESVKNKISEIANTKN